MKLHLSLHDVAPTHLERLKRAEELFEELGVNRVTYLMVPHFHNTTPSTESQSFAEYVARQRPFEVEWVLHGFSHLETSPAQKATASENFKRGWMTGGEGEFLALRESDAFERLQKGVNSFKSLFGTAPSHFVPPAWLWHKELPQALEQAGLQSFESHRGISYLKKDGSWRWIDAPVISWATRSWWRRNGALIVCPLQATLWSTRPLLRIALHPHDFDWPQTRSSIRKLLQKEKERRVALPISELLQPLR